MDKICAKCGYQMQDNDFLCPQCGAIWGDPVYRKPVPPEPVATAQAGEKTEEAPPTKVKSPKRLITAVVALVLLLVLSSVAYAAFRDRDRDLETSNTESTATLSTSTSNPDYIFTMPVATNSDYITYTIKFQDPNGKPIPNVVIVDPDAIFSSSPNPNPLISDANGIILFTTRRDLTVGVRIIGVPSGYYWSNDVSTLYFTDGETEMLITLDLTEQHTHSVFMLDPGRLLMPLNSQYTAGELISVIVDYDADAGYMLFCNGVEVPAHHVVQGEYWIFQLGMPDEDIELDLKVYDITDLPFQHELLIKAYYRQYPSTEYVSVKHDYGSFASGAAVVIFDTNSADFITGYAVAGYQFFFPNTDAFRVLKGGVFLTLKEAYELGYLTEEDIEEIYNQHVQNYPHLHTYDTAPAE